MYKVIISKKILKRLNKLPDLEKKRLKLLLVDLEELGVLLPHWKNFGSLQNGCYHCHLSYKWVACWKWEKKSIVIEVYYVGSREKAPY